MVGPLLDTHGGALDLDSRSHPLLWSQDCTRTGELTLEDIVKYKQVGPPYNSYLLGATAKLVNNRLISGLVYCHICAGHLPFEPAAGVPHPED